MPRSPRPTQSSLVNYKRRTRRECGNYCCFQDSRNSISLQDHTDLVDRIQQENQASKSFNFGSSPQEVLFGIRYVHKSTLMNARIEIPTRKIAAFCRRNRVRRLTLFGSVLRDAFAPDSDVDVLVEFEIGARVGYLGLARIETDLGEILGRKANMLTFRGVESSPNWLLREEIPNSTETIFGETG